MDLVFKISQSQVIPPVSFIPAKKNGQLNRPYIGRTYFISNACWYFIGEFYLNKQSRINTHSDFDFPLINLKPSEKNYHAN